MAIARIDCYSSTSRSVLRRGAVFLIDDFIGMLERIVNWKVKIVRDESKCVLICNHPGRTGAYTLRLNVRGIAL